MSLPRQDCQNDIAGSETGLQRFGTSRFDGRQAMIEHRCQHLDELPIAIGMLGELGADLSQGGRQIPVLEGRTIAQRARLLHQHRQIMPGIIDGLFAPEVARMIGNHLIVEQHDDALCMRSHQNHAAGGSSIDAVTVVIRHDQAGGAGSDCLLDKAIEGSAKLHQAGPLILEDLPDCPVLELRVFAPFGVGNALILQPGIELGQTLDPRLGAEQPITQSAHLVLDLALLPPGRRRARHRLDQIVRAHLQKAAIVLAPLADEDRLHRGLHVVVDATPANPAVELEGLVMGIEDQFLRLAEVGAHKRHAAVRQLHVRGLDRQRQTLQGDRLMAPVDLVSLARCKAHRHECLGWNASPFIPPCPHKAMHAVVSAVITAAAQVLEQPLGRAPLAPRQLGFALQDLGKDFDPPAQLRHRLNRPLVLELRLMAADNLANRRPRYRQRPHDLLDRPLLLKIGASYLADQIHANQPPFPSAPIKALGREAATRSKGVKIVSETTLHGVVIASNSTAKIAQSLPKSAWRRLSSGEGTKGPRLHDWAYLELADLDAGQYNRTLSGEWTRGMLVRRNSADGDLAFFATWCPKNTPMEKLISVEGCRWAIEDSFEAAKNELGLDHNETRSWHGWHRHVSLVMLAFAMMAAIRHRANAGVLKKTMPRPPRIKRS